jgi:hypothetical protein
MHDEQFTIGQRVRIHANGIEGTVNAVFTDADGTQWRVEYASATGVLNDRYCRASEIAAA